MKLNLGYRRKLNGTPLISIVTLMFVCLVWYIMANYVDVPNVVLPKPQDVVSSFIDLCKRGYGINKHTLWAHLSVSLGRLLLAFFISIVLAVPLGVLCGYYETISAIFSPLVEFYRPIPPLAYYTVLVLWFGINESSKIILLFLAGFAPIFISTTMGVMQIDENLVISAVLLGANKRQALFHVIFPAALPSIFTGIRTAIGVEYTTLVAAEMVAANKGIGWMVLDASNWLKSEVVFSGVIVMGLTGIMLNGIIKMIEKTVVHWK